MKIDLSDCTFLIPLRIESEDRARNILCCLKYLMTWFDTKIIVKEVSNQPVLPKLLEINGIDISLIDYEFEEHSGLFHRTRYLNDMIEKSTTTVVCNFDADVVLPIESIMLAYNAIRDQSFDFCYPYSFSTSQRRAFLTNEYFKDFFQFPTTKILDKCSINWIARYGFCFFANKKSYINCGGEIEEFKSYGPEDEERPIRFEKLGYSITRVNSEIYHLEHARSRDSSTDNPGFQSNERLFNTLKTFDSDSLENAIRDFDYIKSRHWVIMQRTNS